MKMSKTMQRQAICEELCRLKNHPTADELHAVVKERMPNISLGTVYRNLDQLSEKGVIRKIEVGGKQKRFDGDTSHHHHLRCRKCGSVVDLPSNKVLAQLDVAMFEAVKHLECENIQVEFKGICRSCK